MAETFSYFSQNNNFEKSFLSSLSQILRENEDNHQMEEIEHGQQHGMWLMQNDNDSQSVGIDGIDGIDNNNGNDKINDLIAAAEEEDDGEEEHGQQMNDDGSHESNSDDGSTDDKLESEIEKSDDSGSNDSDSSEVDEKQMFFQIKNNKKKGPAKVTPLPIPSGNHGSHSSHSNRKKRVQFTGAPETKEIEVPDRDEEIKIIHFPERGDDDDNGTQELASLVKQLVLLESESTKAQQFLQYIQQHNCFDKQDHRAVNNFLDLIEQEKKSLIIVLSNFSPQVQPLITMMTIAERRLALLDNTPLITPGSTLHATFLEKQQLLQDVIDQAAAHVYGRSR